MRKTINLQKYACYSLQPEFLAVARQLARVDVLMNPFEASPVVAGFPMTSLFNGTPLAAIWKRAEFGQVEDELVKSPAQVVYSVIPSVYVAR